MPEFSDLEREVHVYYYSASAFTDDAQTERMSQVLSPPEREQSRRFAFDRDRRSYIAAHWLLRTALSRYLAVEPVRWEFTSGLFGKPRIAAPSEGVSLQFNLSHSSGIVACAVTRAGEVGVDVETVATREFLDLARRFFAPAEVRQLEGLSEFQRPQAFYRIWTLKEAYIKARGEGLSLDLSRFAFLDVFGDEIRIRFGEDWEDRADDWQFFRIVPDEAHLVAAAIHHAKRRKIVWRVFHEIPAGESGEEV